MASKKAQENEPDVLSGYNAKQSEVWNLVSALREGTDSMRAQGQVFLPKEPEETAKKYANRLKRSFLFNAYDESVSAISSKPFSKEVVVEGDEFNEFIAKIQYDTDKEGRNITQFGHDLYDSAVDFGMVSILVDYDNVVDEEGLALSLQGERDNDVRPVFVAIPRKNILGFREDPNIAGRLIQLRIYDTRLDDNGEFGECETELVRVYEPDNWRVYKRESNAGEWSLDSEGINSLGEIPLVNIYFNRKGFMQADPCMESLAWLNLQHYQSSSDQNNILRFARTGTFFGAGFTSEEIKAKLIVGVDNMVKSTNENAKLSVVEFSGAGIEAGSQDLKQIEDRMEMLGLQPMVQQANSTATGAKIDNNKKETFAQAWVRALSTGLEKAYEWAAAWYDINEMPEDFNVNIFDDFGAAIQTDNSMDKVFTANDKGLLTNETTLREMQRRDIIASDIDLEKELEDASSEFDNKIIVDPFQEQLLDEQGNPIDDKKPKLDALGNPIVADPTAGD